MTDDSGSSSGIPWKSHGARKERDRRQAELLRENLRKRKEQLRSRGETCPKNSHEPEVDTDT
ncbi:MAG TPA: hypothetical protein EYO23_02905 [Alphaproteobacteria bacterium]|nr:hypothetical protein [Alphaproteobacteria bacterium]